MLEPALTSLGLVFLAEMGDKTQILALILAARYRKPWQILGGMILAVAANHALASGLGVALADYLPARWFRWAVAASFVAMAAWLLIPDRAEDRTGRRGFGANAFLAALVSFFLAEMGDKTQIATIALAARYQTLVPVLIGSASGMILADVPAIWFGERVTRALPARLMRRVTAALFAVFGVAALVGG